MMATGAPRRRPPAWSASPSTRGVPPPTSTRRTPTPPVSATPTNRPCNPCLQPEHFTAMANGPRPPASPTSPCLQCAEVAGVARGCPLAPPKPHQGQAEQSNQQLGRAAQMRELRHEAQGGAGTVLPRCGRRVPLAFRREGAEFHRGPLRAEADDVAVAQDYVPRDPRTIDEGAVLRAQVADAERRAVPHDGGVARRDVEIALDVEANVRQWMAAEPDVGFAEGRHLPGARARQEPELGGHWLRVAR